MASKESVDEVKTHLATLEDQLSKLSIEAGKASLLEVELKKTKDALDAYKSSGKTVYISKDKKLDKFSGRPVKDTDPTAFEWVEDANHHLKNISGETAQLEFIYDHLMGQAKDEIRIRPESDRNTASKVLDIIKTVFEDAETVGQLQQRFYQRCQKSNESLQTYSLVLMKLMDRITKKDKKVLGDKDLMLKERFIDGVSDSLLRREMKRFSFEHKDLNFIDFRQMILKWTEDESVATLKSISAEDEEAVINQEVSAKHVSSKSKVGEVSIGGQKELYDLLQKQQDMLKEQQKQLDLLTKLVAKNDAPNSEPQLVQNTGRGGFPFQGSGRGRGRGSRGRGQGRTCYGCGGIGHYVRDCPTKKKGQKSSDRNTTGDASGGNTNPLNA